MMTPLPSDMDAQEHRCPACDDFTMIEFLFVSSARHIYEYRDTRPSNVIEADLPF